MTRSATHILARRTGFTLTELMISIALVLILLLAVNKIFQLTSDTISMGQAMSQLTRDGRAAESAFAEDFANMLPSDKQPLLMLWSKVQPAFSSRNDELVDLDGNPATVDIDDDGVEGYAAGEVLSASVPNARMHRVDMISFFRTGRFKRQTGTNNYVDEFASREAWVQYGHSIGKERDDTTPAGRLDMAAGTTGQDYINYANNWLLARNLVLLGHPVTGTNGDGYQDSGGIDLTPLTRNSVIGSGTRFDESHVDVARITVADFLRKITNVRNNSSPGPASWLHYGEGLPLFRVETDATPNLRDGLDIEEFARTIPAFLPSCTQFTVEFAGDFLRQNPVDGMPYLGGVYWDYSAIPVPAEKATDGEIDFLIDPNTGERRIRWYGLPRDVNGDGDVLWYEDVVPLRDLWAMADQPVSGGSPGAAPFERFPGTDGNDPREFDFAADVTWVANRTGTAPSTPGNYAHPTGGLRGDEAYYCVWERGMRMPQMIRIIITINDPNNRLEEGQTFEYIFKVPQ